MKYRLVEERYLYILEGNLTSKVVDIVCLIVAVVVVVGLIDVVIFWPDRCYWSDT